MQRPYELFKLKVGRIEALIGASENKRELEGKELNW
jgi:hypothetical protein